MKIIIAYFTQFLWIVVILTGFLIQPDSLTGYIYNSSIHSPEHAQSDDKNHAADKNFIGLKGTTEGTTEDKDRETDTNNTDKNGAPEKRTYLSKKAELEQQFATLDVGQPAVQPQEKPSDQPAVDPQGSADQTGSKLGSRGGAKSPEIPADTTNTENSADIPPTGKQGYNQIVLNLIKTYKGGGYPYLLNGDYANYNGVTENLYYDGQLFLKAHPSGNRASHCVGITFEVFFKAMQEWNRQRGLDAGRIGNLSYWQLQDFMLQWYVASGQKDQGNLTTALAQYGLGKRITDLNEAQPGDFIDFSRENNTGHTVVFLSWVWEDGQIVGLKYWSSQGTTGGIAKNTEYFNVLRKNGKKGKIMIDKLYIGRVTP